MNIVVLTSSGKVVVRPDTTWKRGNEDYFAPGFVESLSASPAVFVKVSKPGRCVAEKFADRYFDAVAAGVLLYPENLIDGSPEGFATACCLDRTTYMTFPENPLPDLGSPYSLRFNSRELYCGETVSSDAVRKAVEKVTAFCYIRTGDYIAIELSPRKTIITRGDDPVEIQGSFCGNDTLKFRITL